VRFPLAHASYFSGIFLLFRDLPMIQNNTPSHTKVSVGVALARVKYVYATSGTEEAHLPARIQTYVKQFIPTA
jgi:hypothetical protein